MDKIAEQAMTDEGWLRCVADLLQQDEVMQMQRYRHHGSVSCLEHCIHVSYACYNRLKKNEAHAYTAARIGLLHDLFLYQREALPTRRQRWLHVFTHGKVAARNASELVDLSKKEWRAIARHMFPLTLVPSISREGLWLSYYDKVYGVREMMRMHRKER